MESNKRSYPKLAFGCHTHIHTEVSAHTRTRAHTHKHTHRSAPAHIHAKVTAPTHTYTHIDVHLTHTQLIKEILLKSLISAYPVNSLSSADSEDVFYVSY